MSDSDRRRRDVLRTGAGLGATALLGGLGGCLSSVPGVGGDGGGDRPGYARWLPTRSGLGRASDERYLFVTLDVATIADNRDSFSPDAYAMLTDGFGDGQVFPGFDVLDRAVSAQVNRTASSLALEGSFAVDDVTGSLEEFGLSEGESYAGYSVYTAPSATAVGVTDGTLVFASSPDDPRGVLTAAIDTGEGDADGLVDASDDADALVSTLGEGAFANGRIPARGIPDSLQSETLVANGLRGRLSGDTTDVRQVLVYDSEGSVDPAAARDASGTADELDGVSTSQRGRTALIEGSIPTGDLPGDAIVGVSLASGADPGGGQMAPNASFEFDHDREAGTIEITHQGGDTFNQGNTGALRYGVQGGDLREWPLPVSAGDRVTLDGGFSSGDSVVVVWFGPDPDRTALVAEFTVP